MLISLSTNIKAMKLNKGDKVIVRSPAMINENPPYNKIGGHVQYSNPATVTKVFSHGIRTKEYGYVHRNNIIDKI